MKALKLFFALSTLTSTLSLAQNIKIQWEQSYGGTGSDYGEALQQTTNGGFIIAGLSDSRDGDVTGTHGNGDYWIVRLNRSGSIKWENSYGGTDYDEASSIEQTTDGGYIVAGNSWSIDGDVTGHHGGPDDYNGDYWIVKIDSFGTVEWEKSYGGSDVDEATDVKQTSDGGYIIAGYSFSIDGDVSGNHGAGDIWIVKIDYLGNVQWQAALGGSNFDYASSIELTHDGGFIIAGYTDSNDGNVSGHHGAVHPNDDWIVKLDSIGNIQWQECLGGALDDAAFSIKQTTDHGFIIAGYSESNSGNVHHNYGFDDYWIIKTDSLGKIEWQKAIGGFGNDIATSIIETKDGNYVVAGSSGSNNDNVTGNHGGDDYWVVKLNSRGKPIGRISLGGSYNDDASSIIQCSDGSIMVCGSSDSNDDDVTGHHGLAGNGSPDYWLVRLSSSTLDKLFSNYQQRVDQIPVSTNSQDGGQMLIFPTSTHSSFNINLQIQNTMLSSAKIELINEIGEVVLIKNAIIANGILQTQITMDATLPKEMYLVRVIVGSKTFTSKIFHE